MFWHRNASGLASRWLWGVQAIESTYQVVKEKLTREIFDVDPRKGGKQSHTHLRDVCVFCLFVLSGVRNGDHLGPNADMAAPPPTPFSEVQVDWLELELIKSSEKLNARGKREAPCLPELSNIWNNSRVQKHHRTRSSLGVGGYCKHNTSLVCSKEQQRNWRDLRSAKATLNSAVYSRGHWQTLRRETVEHNMHLEGSLTLVWDSKRVRGDPI